MKKVYKHILILSLSFGCMSTTYAMCHIQKGPAPFLTQTLKKQEKIIKNIHLGIQKNTLKVKKARFGNKQTLKIFTKLINDNTYLSYWNYFIIYPLSNEIPKEIKRDHAMLEKQKDSLHTLLQSTITSGNGNISLTREEICAGIDADNCPFNQDIYKVGEVLSIIITEQLKLLDLYRSSVMDGENIFANTYTNSDFTLIDTDELETKNIPSEMLYYYGPQNTCRDISGNFKKSVYESLERLTLSHESSQKAFEKWQEAIDLLTNDSSEVQKAEKKLLESELARQGVSLRGADAIQSALESYNTQEGFSLSNNPITNSVVYVYNSLSEQTQKFYDNVFTQDKEEKTVGEIIQTKEKNEADIDIIQSVAQEYAKQIPALAEGEQKNAHLESRIIKMHTDINLSIDALVEACVHAVRICNSQDSGAGKCGDEQQCQ